MEDSGSSQKPGQAPPPSALDSLATVNSGRLARRQGYCEIPTSIFVTKIDVHMSALPEVALYQWDGDRFQLLRGAHQPYSLLALSVHPSVWVKEDDFAIVRSYAESLLLNPKLSSGLSIEKRMETLRRSAILVVEDIFENPSPENINRGVKMVSSFVHVLMKEPNAYLMLANLSSHDPYTLQHSVGTAVNCIILGRKVGVHDEKELNDLGMGGLLHDIGKVKVRREVINKEGPLDEFEWEEMRQHSGEGYEIVKDNPNLAESTKLAILEHHEDKNGTGYPNRIPISQTHLYSRITSICDVFNALTTNRSYSTARTPFDALSFMREKMTHKLEDQLFRELVMVYGGKFD